MTANGYEALAHLDLARGRFDDALKDFTELAARDEDPHRRELGLVRLFLKQDDGAIADLREQAVLDAKDPWAPFFLSAALERSGRHAEAVEQGQLYLKLKTDDGIWRQLALSHEPAFLEQARAVREALHNAGLDEPGQAKL
jgi:tetratricopeptide (TPR) repeat protein